MATVTTRRMQLPAEPLALPAARRAIIGLESDLDPGLFYDISLCVSELVATSLRDAQPGEPDAIELALSLSEQTLSAAVRSMGSIAPALERRDGDSADEDLGLYIISRLADRWGVDRAESRVWIEFDLAGGARARAPAFRGEGEE